MEIKNPVLRKIWEDRYKKGNETVDENIMRVAKYIARDCQEEEEFYKLMSEGLFLPAGRTMSNSGIGKNLTLNNCFVLNSVEDSIVDIFDAVKMGAITQKAGGGTGYDFSKIRPKDSPTSNDAIASGVVSFMDVFNAQTACILQGNRRGANMGILNVRHPDIYDFINAKSYEANKLVHFNVSVMVDDDFMKAVENNEKFTLHYPVYDDKGAIIKDETKYTCTKVVDALDLWNQIMQKAYDNGEPGIFFYENLNRDNNTYYMENIIATNPCAEFLSGLLYDNVEQDSSHYKGACNLGSLFLHRFIDNPFTENAKIDYNKLKTTIKSAVKILDNIIDINKFPHEDYKNYQQTLRTIGLGITSLGDALAMMNIKYGNNLECIEFIDELMNFITSEVYLASSELATERGSFKAFDCDKYLQSNFIQKHLKKYPNIWNKVVDSIKRNGMRNARCISIAPTGTLSLTFGNNCSSGLEPIFSLSYDRKVKMGGQDDSNIEIIKMEDYAYKIWKETKNDNIVKEDVFVTALNLDVEDHISVLKTIAYHVDMSSSKTVNVPTDYPFEKCKNLYMDAWKCGIKGLTIFRPNDIRGGILISESKEEPKEEIKELQRGEWKPLAEDTIYIKKPLNIGCGRLKLFIGYSPSERAIQDIYVKKSSGAGCVHNIESVAVCLSAIYRLGGSTKNIEKAFRGLGGCNSFLQAKLKGVELSKGSSCATAILKILQEVEKEQGLEPIAELMQVKLKKTTEEADKEVFTKQEKEYRELFGDIAFAKKYHKCPICGEKLENTGGCMSCLGTNGCGWTKCE